MTKKLIEGALGSPSLVNELNQYHKQQIKKNAQRGLIVLLSGVFLVFQYIGISQPISGAGNTEIRSDTVHGGIDSKQELILAYDNRKSDFNKSSEALSIKRNDLTNLKEGTTKKWPESSDTLVVAWSKSPIYKLPSENYTDQPANSFLATDKSNSFKYFGHVVNTQKIKDYKYQILYGQSPTIGQFAILKNSGNYLTTNFDTDICYKKPNNNLSFNFCPNSNSFESTISAKNLTYKTDANFIKNRPSDRIEYTIKVKNKNTKNIKYTPLFYMGDILEYSEISSIENARYNKSENILEWPETEIKPNQQKTFNFTTSLLSKTPLNASPTTNTSSYDCLASSFLGTENSVKVSCPTPKIIERMANIQIEAPTVLLAWFLFITNLLLFIRSYIYTKEREIILKDMRKKHG